MTIFISTVLVILAILVAARVIPLAFSKLVALLGFLVLELVVLFLRLGFALSGMPRNEKDLKRLRKLAKTAVPLIDALENFREDRGYYPESLNELYPDYLNSSFKTIVDGYDGDEYFVNLYLKGRQWSYYMNRKHDCFLLDIKLWWETSLYYNSEEKKWYYDPGDGTDITIIEI
jgi:hypothetical protein